MFHDHYALKTTLHWLPGTLLFLVSTTCTISHMSMKRSLKWLAMKMEIMTMITTVTAGNKYTETHSSCFRRPTKEVDLIRYYYPPDWPLGVNFCNDPNCFQDTNPV